ncbi:hypothetical protein DY000_02054340 [Brassica cretica]|uniref:Uncharacterized protein n=1 Tax=Brassica cretica TaxID=69181 RepID=A0ABQ7A782_BRACR|nr:hypothetical protein DY000_02054340 [Brassica cretica]
MRSSSLSSPFLVLQSTLYLPPEPNKPQDLRWNPPHERPDQSPSRLLHRTPSKTLTPFRQTLRQPPYQHQYYQSPSLPPPDTTISVGRRRVFRSSGRCSQGLPLILSGGDHSSDQSSSCDAQPGLPQAIHLRPRAKALCVSSEAEAAELETYSLQEIFV